MDFNLSEEQQMLSDMALRFIADKGARGPARHVEETAERDWPVLADMGWLALAIPEEFGGIGGDAVDVMILAAALGRGYAMGPYIRSAILGARLLELAGNRGSMLQEIAEGGLRLALAHQHAGSPLTAAAVDGGYRLSGTKFQVLGADTAGKLIVTAEDPSTRQLSLFLVEGDAPGISLSTYAMIDDTRASDVTFQDVVLTADALLLSGPEAMAALDDAIDRATLAWLSEAIGIIEASIETCSEYLKTRVQFGQPIGSFQALQHIMAAMFVEAQEARSIVYYALSHAGDAPEVRCAAISAAKIIVGRAAQYVSRQGIQLHGGYGMTDEYLISHQFRRLMMIEKIFGDIDAHCARLAELSLN